ncbi:hypothetical protein DFH09DRAFT_1085398 [Mycena vulgaris]|nr:hypothetical protein DFH09DRAFT_1085398 [Mycena vulgaris]
MGVEWAKRGCEGYERQRGHEGGARRAGKQASGRKQEINSSSRIVGRNSLSSTDSARPAASRRLLRDEPENLCSVVPNVPLNDPDEDREVLEAELDLPLRGNLEDEIHTYLRQLTRGQAGHISTIEALRRKNEEVEGSRSNKRNDPPNSARSYARPKLRPDVLPHGVARERHAMHAEWCTRRRGTMKKDARGQCAQLALRARRVVGLEEPESHVQDRNSGRKKSGRNNENDETNNPLPATGRDKPPGAGDIKHSASADAQTPSDPGQRCTEHLCSFSHEEMNERGDAEKGKDGRAEEAGREGANGTWKERRRQKKQKRGPMAQKREGGKHLHHKVERKERLEGAKQKEKAVDSKKS